MRNRDPIVYIYILAVVVALVIGALVVRVHPASAELIPNRFGLAIYCIHNVYEKMSEAVELEGDYRVLVVPDVRPGATIKGRNIYISYKLVQSFRNIDELACLIGHEIAHIKLGHILSGKSTSDKMEAEADYWGYRYAVLVGYNPDVCGLLVRKDFPLKRIQHLKALLACRTK